LKPGWRLLTMTNKGHLPYSRIVWAATSWHISQRNTQN
jgi:hypothetical protein